METTQKAPVEEVRISISRVKAQTSYLVILCALGFALAYITSATVYLNNHFGNAFTSILDMDMLFIIPSLVVNLSIKSKDKEV
jgi:hypothetical protein